MELIKGQKYAFPIKETKIENGDLYYVINVNGYDCPLKVFPFQRGTNRPPRVQCVFRGYNGANEPLFMQDIEPLLKQLYKIGETYEFKVKGDYSESGYYEVVDKNGFILRLTDYGKAKVYVNQVIKAKVKSINLIRVELSLITNKKHEGILFMPPESVFSLDSTNVINRRFPIFLFKKLPAFKEARAQYESGNALWVIAAIDVVDKNLAEWLNSGIKHKRKLLMIYHSICTNLLEKSDYLKDCTEEERIECQKKVSVAITHAEDYLVALNLIREGRSQWYIDDNLERLKHSGYLYQPEKKMRVMMSIFTLRQESVQSYIQDIFDIIREGHDNDRFMEQFSNAFIEMLDVYIWNESKSVNLISSIYDTVSKQRIEEMAEALAIQLILVEKKEYGDKALCRSMLYRFASLITPMFSNSLLEKAYYALFQQQMPPLEYSWNDLSQMRVLCSKLSSASSKAEISELLSYHGQKAVITLDSQAVSIMPLKRGTQLKKAYPDGITPWQNIQFLLNERLDEKVSPSVVSIKSYEAMWKELERSLFAEKQVIPRKVVNKNLTPDIGDKVYIRITGQVPEKKFDFYCKIEDPTFVGEGQINTHQIVHYNVDATMDSFRQKDTKIPYLLRATVESIDANGKIKFNMLKEIADFINDTTSSGDEVLAQVSMNNPTNYICITELGFALSINKKETLSELNVGDFVIAQVDTVKVNGNVNAFFMEKSEDTFDCVDGFNCLIEDYADGKLYEEKEIETQEEESILTEDYIEQDVMEELVHIIDRYSMTQSSQVTAYNYLAVAKLLSMVMSNPDLADYYSRRMELLKVLQRFGELDKIKDEELDELLDNNEAFISNYPDIKNKLTQLKIINHLDKPWNDDYLWELAKKTENKDVSSLARLVLTHNMMDGFNVYEQRMAIRKKIYQMMDLNMRIPETSFVAEEDQFTELKTSMIYPAGNNMRADEKQQIKELMTVVCSFLNARGGTLYVGVNNLGSATGLDTDFIYINNGRGGYDLTDVKDKFDLRFRNAVHNMLGGIANNMVSCEFLTVNGKTIYKVVVEPCKDLVFLEGTAYVRQGTSKWPIQKSEIESFKKQRATQFS